MFDKPEEPPQGLHKTKKFNVEILCEKDIPAFLDLQQKVEAIIPDDKKHYLKIRSKDDLLNHIGHRMPIIGVKDEHGKLVGQCLLSYPTHSDVVKNIDGYPFNGAECTTAIVQSLAVDPKMRGQKISDMLLECAKDLAAMSGHVYILGKVAADNAPSTKSFINAAFTKASGGLDPIKNYPVNYWRHDVYNVCTATPV